MCGGSTGSAGFDTGLAPSMTIGTGFTGRSSLGENLEPRHLLNHARIAYNNDVREVPEPGSILMALGAAAALARRIRRR